MDTLPSEEATYPLPSPRNLLLSSCQEQQTQDPPADNMMIDEPFETKASPLSASGNGVGIAGGDEKPQLPSITNMQPYSPIPHSHTAAAAAAAATTTTTTLSTPASDEYLRHRMSDMSMTSSLSGAGAGGGGTLPMGRSHSNSSSMYPSNNSPATLLSPLEPSHYDANLTSSMSRRGSLVTPSTMLHDYRRPSITELNSLPLPTASSSTSRRASVATVITEYDYHSSRSPSPSHFKQQQQQHDLQHPSDLEYHPSSLMQNPPSPHDPFYRRHSIATAEPSYPSSSSRLASKQRPFRFPATIHESPNGVYSAPSSPPETTAPSHMDSAMGGGINDLGAQKHIRTHGMRHGASDHPSHHYTTSSSYHSPGHLHSQQQQHSQSQRFQPGHPYAGGYSRRRSILNDEETPSLARRASMPVVTMGRAPASSSLFHHPPTPTPTPPHHHHHHHQHHPQQHQHAHHSHHQKISSRLGNDAYESHFQSNTNTANHLSSSAAGSTPNEESVMMDEERDSHQDQAALTTRKPETPYSRSPELRVSHKLAERKRRKEMKELFDELRDSLPVEKNLKTSKWEILSKAVEYITVLKRRDFEKENEVNTLRHELAIMKRERSGNYGALPY